MFKLQEKETKSDSIRDRKTIQEQVLFYLIGAVENFNGLTVLLENAMLMNSIELPQMPLRSVTGAIKYICDDFKPRIGALIQCLIDVFENLSYQYSWAIPSYNRVFELVVLKNVQDLKKFKKVVCLKALNTHPYVVLKLVTFVLNRAVPRAVTLMSVWRDPETLEFVESVKGLFFESPANLFFKMF